MSIARTPAEVAAIIGPPATEDWVRRKARAGAPHLRLARNAIAFTDEQINELVALATHSTPQAAKPTGTAALLTPRSAARQRGRKS